jgi:hypothetical protein
MDRLRFIAIATIGLLAAMPGYGQDRRVFEIDAAQSDVHWRVYKAGAFARLGHNHTVSVAGLRGRVELADDLAASDWQIEFDVADLIIDDPELRARYGEDFSSEPSADDIEGTRGNMLGEQVLNGAEYQSIVLRGRGLTGGASAATLRVAIDMLGRTVELDLPARIDVDGDTLNVSGEFSLDHADLGMKPFSVMMGALQVGPMLDFTYRIRATAVGR